jgi:DNA repair protein RecO (recombination protein O)
VHKRYRFREPRLARLRRKVSVEWSDIGIVLGARRLGEAHAVAELMTREHGRHLGLVRGGAGSRRRPVLQAGNLVSATWRARLDEHLGYFAVEAIDLRAASFLPAEHALYGVHHLAALCRLLPERDPHRRLFELLDATLRDLVEVGLGERGPRPAAARMARFELRLLAELGFGLDLASCVATGATGAGTDLAYVSPKSGRAVSRGAGEPWRDKLLPLPAFLCDSAVEPSAAALRDGFALTGFFLARHLFEPRGETLPPARSRFIAAVERNAKES